MESLQNNQPVDISEKSQQPKSISVDNYVSVFNHDFLKLLENRLNSLFVRLVIQH